MSTDETDLTPDDLEAKLNRGDPVDLDVPDMEHLDKIVAQLRTHGVNLEPIKIDGVIHDRTRRAAHDYLKSKSTTLWADWDLSRPDSFEKAVDWLTAQVEAVNTQARSFWFESSDEV